MTKKDVLHVKVVPCENIGAARVSIYLFSLDFYLSFVFFSKYIVDKIIETINALEH